MLIATLQTLTDLPASLLVGGYGSKSQCTPLSLIDVGRGASPFSFLFMVYAHGYPQNTLISHKHTDSDLMYNTHTKARISTHSNTLICISHVSYIDIIIFMYIIHHIYIL